MKEIQTPKGLLKYRMPNVSEGFEFLSLLEVVKTNSDMFRVKAKLIGPIENLVDYSSCGYASYKELLDDKENMFHPLSEIAQEVYSDIVSVLIKKT
jgi:hypothetical protein